MSQWAPEVLIRFTGWRLSCTLKGSHRAEITVRMVYYLTLTILQVWYWNINSFSWHVVLLVALLSWNTFIQDFHALYSQNQISSIWKQLKITEIPLLHVLAQTTQSYVVCLLYSDFNDVEQCFTFKHTLISFSKSSVRFKGCVWTLERVHDLFINYIRVQIL